MNMKWFPFDIRTGYITISRFFGMMSNLSIRGVKQFFELVLRQPVNMTTSVHKNYNNCCSCFQNIILMKVKQFLTD